MRLTLGTTTAALLIASTALLSAAPAFADDDIYFNHAKGTMSGAAPQSAPQSADQNSRYRASYQQQYMQMDPRDMKVDHNARKNVDGDNIYFNHAEGTMSGN